MHGSAMLSVLEQNTRPLERLRLVLPEGVSPVGLVLADDLPVEDWHEIGRHLYGLSNSVRWWIGDWLLYGERQWGAMYQEAAETTGYKPETVRMSRYVAERFEIVRRRTDLSWSHHCEVASLSVREADALLARASRGHWGHRKLREVIKGVAEPAETMESLRAEVKALRAENSVLTAKRLYRKREQSEQRDDPVPGWRAPLIYHEHVIEAYARLAELGIPHSAVELDGENLESGFVTKMLHPDEAWGRQSSWHTWQRLYDRLYPEGFHIRVFPGKRPAQQQERAA